MSSGTLRLCLNEIYFLLECLGVNADVDRVTIRRCEGVQDLLVVQLEIQANESVSVVLIARVEKLDCLFRQRKLFFFFSVKQRSRRNDLEYGQRRERNLLNARVNK